MADLALLFHWPPSEMDRMSLPELARWHDRAIARAEIMGGAMGGGGAR